MSTQSSPAAGSPMPEMLTPRSKVAKMLADIDNALTPSPPQRASDHETRDLSSPISGAVVKPPVIAKASGPFDTDSGSDEDEAPLRRPKGRVAQRMLGLGSDSPPTRSSPPKRLRSSPVHRPSLDADEDLCSATPLMDRIVRRPASRSPSRSAKSGALFVSPAKTIQENDSDDELPSNPFGSKEKLAELVAAKRQERLQREEQEEQTQRSLHKGSRKRRRSESAHASSDLPEGIVDNSGLEANPEIERIMSDAARPTRKASKKALLEMERETQRLARQQALAHQMKVKKKFTTSDLFARFNFRQPQGDAVENAVTGDTTASSDPASGTPNEPVSTPPSSPPTAGPTPLQKQEALVELGALSKMMPVREDSIASLAQMLEDGSDDEMPDIAEVMRASREAKKPASVEPQPSPIHKEQMRRGLKLARFGKKAVAQPSADSSDDDLEIIAPLPRHLQVFDKVKPLDKHCAADSRALHALRHLSHMGGYDSVPNKKPGKAASRPSIGPKALEAQLRRKAKDQARMQQQERIAELKAKGIVIQTGEEREREAEVFENLLEKARQDAQSLRKAEKAAAKGDGEGGDGAVASDDEEDEEYVGSESEEEGGEGEEDEEEHDGLIDEAAEESEEDEEQAKEGDGLVEDGDELNAAPTDGQGLGISSIDAMTPAPGNRKARQSRVILDEDDSDDDDGLPKANNVQATPAPEEEDPFAAFNFQANGGSDDALLSPTQAFQATMQTPTQQNTQEDSFDILRKIAPPSMISMPPTLAHEQGDTQQEESQLSVVPGSQVPESQRIELAWDTQPPETPTIGTMQRGPSTLTETPGWDPTQDAGIPSPFPLELRRENTLDTIAEEHDTQSTVRLRVSESPMVAATPAQRRGRLMRRQAASLADSSDDDEELQVPAKLAKKDAFREMARRRQDALTETERAEAAKEMKQMLEEQAEESEDEYAGLGGDDFVAPENDADRAMIDSSNVDVDERQIARIFAEKQRQREEEETSKLYKDLTTGALRRKQAGASWGLEEDEGEMAMRRRQMRQLEEARKRKLLLQDDNIAGLAQGKQSKGKDAFLKAIADDDDAGDDDMYDLSGGEDEFAGAAVEETQTESQPSQQPQQAETRPLREVSGNKRPATEENTQGRPPAKQRRTQPGAFRKPASMLEVRESLSFLLEEPDAVLAGPTVELDSDSENGEQSPEHADSDEDDADMAERERQNDGGFAPNAADFDARAMPPPRLPASQRRTAAPVSKPTVVDRLSLKRGNSNANGPAGPTAWAAPNSSNGFRAPSLLRRATTANTMSGSGANDRGVTIGTGSANLSRENSGSGVRMGGSKKSSLAYQARADERKAIVEASTRRRQESTKRIAELRRSSTSALLGKGLGGRFE
ncbi:hypothetical protein LTR97_000046 [Elasticomyces elasticus]|uniref:DNA replication checkpoint mediator MRC1 domain-containing protein n=1 Tax=Elasticomyces elasticus TaxID=574655 RepID=A0AAN7VWW7_9PEZI|nr:hypothetical protein LTR97_000046 [Elasticomyces elasticus]